MRIHHLSRPGRDSQSRESGIVAVVVALLAVVLLGFGALAVDVGLLYAKRQAYGAGADSASLAVVRGQWAALVSSGTSATCGELVTADNALPANEAKKSVNVAYAAVNANAPFGVTVPASEIDTKLQCLGPTAGTLVATVSISSQEATLLGGALGRSSMVVTRDASAVVAVANAVRGLRPLALCVNQKRDIPEDGSPTLIFLDKVWTGAAAQCGENGKGNWGWVFCSGHGSVSLASDVLSGCDDPFTVTDGGTTAEGTPGNKGSSNNVTDAMQAILGEDSVLLVYDTVAGSGATATYRTVGFITLTICAYQSSGKSVSLTTGSCAETDPSILVDESLIVKWKAFTPIGEANLDCAIGDPTCDFSAYVVRLVE